MVEFDKTPYKHLVYPLIGACQEVHLYLGGFLNEYMYQDALAIELSLRHIPFEKEYYFTASYKERIISHKHYVDFLIQADNQPVILECKAADKLIDTHRQQLWNYMRLSSIQIGVLYNFAPAMAQCEKYYYDIPSRRMMAF